MNTKIKIVSALILALMLVSTLARVEATTKQDIEGKSNHDAAKTLEESDTASAATVMDELDPEKTGELLDEMNASAAALIVANMNEAKASLALEYADDAKSADILELMDAGKASNIIEDVSPTRASSVVAEMSPDKAAAVVENMNATRAMNVLLFMSLDDAAKLSDAMDKARLAEVVSTAIDEDQVDGVTEILLAMNASKSGEVMTEFDAEHGGAVLESLVGIDANATAPVFEDSVKLGLNSASAGEKERILGVLTGYLTYVSDEGVASLFGAMARLPNTPGTVAALMDRMDLGKAVNVTVGWIAFGDLADLGKVLGLVSTSRLQAIYRQLGSVERAAISPYLSAQTLAQLPDVGSFSVLGLSISPAQATLGKIVTASVVVKNVGSEAGKYVARFALNGTVVNTQEVPLGAGESKTVTCTVNATSPGVYQLVVGDEKEHFFVLAPKAADFRTTSLVVSKPEVAPNESETVTVVVSNVGEASGTYDLVINVDGVQKVTDSVTLDGGASTTKTYTVASDATGVRTVSMVGGPSAQFTVAGPNYVLYGGVAVLVVAVAAVVYLVARKR